MNGPALHARIAEGGKLWALEKNHAEALRHYREAMRLCADEPSSDLPIRHYTECAVESLERMGAFAEVIAYCRKVLDHYDRNPPENPLARLDHARAHERLGVALFKSEGAESARASFAESARLSRGAGRKLPLTEAVLGWITRGWHVDRERLEREQERLGYFAVREGAVHRGFATRLPGSLAALPR